MDGTSPLIISFFVKGGGMGNWGWGEGYFCNIYIHMYNVCSVCLRFCRLMGLSKGLLLSFGLCYGNQDLNKCLI